VDHGRAFGLFARKRGGWLWSATRFFSYSLPLRQRLSFSPSARLMPMTCLREGQRDKPSVFWKLMALSTSVGTVCLCLSIEKARSVLLPPTLVRINSPDKAEAFWSGPTGGSATAVSLGNASGFRGCWIVEMGFEEETAVCSWDKKQRLFLGPASADPQPLVAQILSSAGLGTENATVTAVKDRDGAIAWCRQSFDFSIKCIEDTLKDSNSAPAKVTLHANCKTKRFTDFWGRNLEALDGDILNLDLNEKIGISTGAGSIVASSAFKTLCPEEPK
jgi:hypothetical protein